MSDYVIQKGDTLSKIAKQYGVTVQQLQTANNIKNTNLIFAGNTLKIPDQNSDDTYSLMGLDITNTTESSNLQETQAESASSQKEEQVTTESSQEKVIGDWSKIVNHEKDMLCRDDSGKTKNISGEFNSDDFKLNPEEFTITDTSSGQAHVYLYKKIAVNEDGNPIYKAVSMNGRPLKENQYTLVWKDESTPELVQFSSQDNYGINLRFEDEQKSLTSSDLTDNSEQSEAPAPDNLNQPEAPSDKDKETTIWLNRMPGPSFDYDFTEKKFVQNNKPKTITDFRRECISACLSKGIHLNSEQLEHINHLNTEDDIIQYLKTLNINVKFAY